jgi:glucose-6-phosphate isomerase, archaeal
MNDKDILNFLKPFTIGFDLETGISDEYKSTKRKLSDMKGMYYDSDELNRMLKSKDELVYEFYELGAPEDAGDIAFGTSIVYPGKVGNEYYMTKGHFHKILDTAEVYICVKGHGYMLLENPEGEWNTEKLSPGRAVYCSKRFAHRSINVGETPMITFFAFRGDAGHDYGTIETKGYRKLIVEKDGKPSIIENPRWK